MCSLIRSFSQTWVCLCLPLSMCLLMAPYETSRPSKLRGRPTFQNTHSSRVNKQSVRERQRLQCFTIRGVEDVWRSHSALAYVCVCLHAFSMTYEAQVPCYCAHDLLCFSVVNATVHVCMSACSNKLNRQSLCVCSSTRTAYVTPRHAIPTLQRLMCVLACVRVATSYTFLW